MVSIYTSIIPYAGLYNVHGINTFIPHAGLYNVHGINTLVYTLSICKYCIG